MVVTAFITEPLFSKFIYLLTSNFLKQINLGDRFWPIIPTKFPTLIVTPPTYYNITAGHCFHYPNAS